MARPGTWLGVDPNQDYSLDSLNAAMAPGFIVAQLCDYVDLDGPTFLAQDRSPSVTYDEGSVFCGDGIWGDGK